MKVVVVGAGVAGLSAAHAVGAAGHQVTIVDPDPQRAAARIAAGRLAPVLEAEFGQQKHTALCLDAAARWGSWAAELALFVDDKSWYQPSGMIMASRNADDTAAIARLAEYQTSLGLDVEHLSGRNARMLEPALSAKVRSGLHVRGDHMVDNRALLNGLHSACRQHGVSYVVEKAKMAGPFEVVTDQRHHDADAVILAAGAWTSEIELADGLPRIDVHPVKGQILRLQAGTKSLCPKYPIDGLDVYLVPRVSGEVVVGATVEDVGFDDTLTAGAVHELLRRARELVPGVDEMALVETSVGFRPATQDHMPHLGPIGPDGPFVATGLYRNGILLAPLVGDFAIAWLSGDGV